MIQHGLCNIGNFVLRDIFSSCANDPDMVEFWSVCSPDDIIQQVKENISNLFSNDLKAIHKFHKIADSSQNENLI